MSDNIEKCDYCGCKFRVEEYRGPGCNETEAYFCPECRKCYFTFAANTPTVTLISPRTDGRTDKYKNLVNNN